MTDREQNWEDRAKWAEEMGVPNLASALRNKALQDTCKDITDYSGWIRVQTEKPTDAEDVLITDGTKVWIGNYISKRSEIDKWAVVYDGDPPFKSHQIIAWQYMPYIPSELKEQI
jgi:hypothetical protein